ncbi:MAG TPA: hypothetical protein VLT33_23615 [Labilithrix sp.]|nr:hypothetical protein [Labilithrix sp.]
MIPRRVILGTIVIASLATACTAIVLGKVSETSDYRTVPVGSSTSALDDCSLLRGDYSGSDVDANACSTCIETSCKTDVEFACNRGSSTKKVWFDKLKKCAQRPWIDGYEPPDETSGFYECAEFRDAEAPIIDDASDTQKEIEAHNCVTNNCLSGALPACKQCEVSIKKSSAEPTPALLKDDGCGKCLVEKCQDKLVKCCGTDPMNDFVKKCAFTNDPANMATCLELGKEAPDSGDNDYADASVNATCLGEIAQCFKANCAGKQGYTCP